MTYNFTENSAFIKQVRENNETWDLTFSNDAQQSTTLSLAAIVIASFILFLVCIRPRHRYIQPKRQSTRKKGAGGGNGTLGDEEEGGE